MFDAQCDLAALVYDEHQEPDAVLRDFAADLNARGFRAVGMVQAGQCADSSLSAVLVHSGENCRWRRISIPRRPAAGSISPGCRTRAQGLPTRLQPAPDLVIINRFGKRERDGKGLAYLIKRALDADIPVVIAVSAKSFADWIKFAGGMSVKLACDRSALEAWRQAVSSRNAGGGVREHATVCEVLK